MVFWLCASSEDHEKENINIECHVNKETFCVCVCVLRELRVGVETSTSECVWLKCAVRFLLF